MRLFIDIGNSRIKLVEHKLHFGEVTTISNNTELLSEMISDCFEKLTRPEKIFVTNVAGNKFADVIRHQCGLKWSLVPQFLKVTKECSGVSNGYTNIEQLGIDRWAVIVAAWAMYQNTLLIVDCGSAVTVDLIHHDGSHLGGYIIPGCQMMTDGLTSNTDQISSLEIEQISSNPGRSTEECVVNGTIYAVIGFIEKLFHDFSQNTKSSFQCIITGGGAELFMNRLSIPYTYVPMLVFDGMKIISENCE
jgi:type III pantothenate kinase